MKSILLIGSGGREHALAWKLAQSEKINKIYVAPGNAGTAQLAKTQNVPGISILDFEGLIKFAKEHRIYMTVVGPDDPLALGIVDNFQSAGLRIWGPTRAAAELEASKAFSKQLMQEAKIPTAEFRIFKSTEHQAAMAYIDEMGAPIVVKASGLALGKGAIVCNTVTEAKSAVEEIAIKKTFGAAGDELVIEEFLDGPEISIHAFSDGKSYKMFPSAQDHKAIGEGNTGPNTGGMGTIAPLTWVDAKLMQEIETKVVKPTIDAMLARGKAFKGLLYPGLKLSSKGIKVLEYNARFGDPETQTYMRLLKTDLLDILDACIDGTLDKLNIEWHNASACTVVLASAGYPGAYEKGKVIEALDQVDAEVVVFHAGTQYNGVKLATNGGRVLGISALGASLEEALNKAYKAAEQIQFEGKTFRKDIGRVHMGAL